MTTIKRKCQVIMLSTNEKAISSEFIIGKRIKTTEKTPDKLVYGFALSDIIFQRQHLYILSDEKIKEDDWYYFNVGYASGVKIANEEDIEQINFEINPKKIIATTNENLGLPQLSKEFIETYILSYNMGSMITLDGIMVEYEDFISSNPIWNSKNPLSNVIVRPRVDRNNCIIITAVKTTYSREEVKIVTFSQEMDKLF